MQNHNSQPPIVADDAYSQHLTGPGHPECPERYWAIKNALIPKTPHFIKPRMATRDEVLLCHTEEYYELVKQEVDACQGVVFLSTGDAPICPASWDIAHLAVGGVLVGVDEVMKGAASKVFCLVRPPGHHATQDRGMGFCVFNNVAIGARYAQKKYGLERVLIVDWDVHHGNGTQDIFEKDPSVFYFSTHQARIYPGTGWEEERGVGNIRNCPIVGGSKSREEVLGAFRDVMVPCMESFRPELVMISAGFDGHELDPLGGFNLRDEDYGELTRIVCEVAGDYAEGRVVSVLEGGDDLGAIAQAAKVHVEGLVSYY